MTREGEGTKFLIDRKIFSSDIWFASPWKLKIWVYLIGNANHKPGMFMGIPIERGQLIRSYRTIAKECGYKVGYRLKKPSLGTVKNICEELTKDLRIHRRSVQAGTLFTICNYNELQVFARHDMNTQLNSDYTVTEQNKNDINDKKEKNKELFKKTFDLFWQNYPRRQSRKKAFEAWLKLHDPETVIEKLKTVLPEQKASDQWTRDNGKYIPLPATYINQARWEDEI